MPRADRSRDLSSGPAAAGSQGRGEPRTPGHRHRIPLTRRQFGLKGTEVTDIQTQYSTGGSRQAIKQALVAAGKDLDHLRPADLALLEDFHAMGRIATTQLADLAEVTPGDKVLDAGSGIGGTARYLAERSRCHVVAVDLTEEYCAAARWLNQLAGLDDRITVRQADVTDLPFGDRTFTLMFSQHVQMNVPDKALLYAEAHRVLADGGRLAVWDIAAGENSEPDFPLPWADRPEYSHLTTPDRLRQAIATAGFEIQQWNDLTDQAAATMQTLLTLPPSPIGLHAFVPNFQVKATNLTAALADGRLRAVQGLARAI
jgi:sarcosine/dimethylglycine N-methyltransferase